MIIIQFIISGIIDTKYSFYFNPENIINECYLSYNVNRYTYISNFAFYNNNFGIKRLTLKIDSLKFAKRVYLGDYNELRGLTIEKFPIFLTPTVRLGREKDLFYRFFPYFRENLFTIGFSVENNFFKSSLVYRGDKSRYSLSEINTVLRNVLSFNKGNLFNKINVGLGSSFYENEGHPGYDLEYIFDYKRERFIQIIRYRNIKDGFVNERNQYYKDGRLEIYSMTGYTYPFGFGFRYGFMFNGPHNDIIKKFFHYTSYKYRTIMFNFFNNIEFKVIDIRNIYRGFNIVYSYKSFYTGLNYYYNRSGYISNSNIINNISEIFDINLKYSPIPNSYYFMNIRKELNNNRYYTIFGFNLPFGKKTRINFEFATLYNNLNFRTSLKFNPTKDQDLLTSLSYNLNDNRFTLSLDYTSRLKTEGIGLGGVFGKVYYDKNNNDIFDEDDIPIKNAIIVLDDKTQINCDRNGNYKYYFLSSGEHRIKVDIKNTPAFIGPSKYEYVFNAENIKLINIDFPLKGLGGIYGKIFFDKNGNSILDKDEEGIPNIIVKIQDTDLFTLTDMEGDFRIENLLPGFYTLNLSNIPNGYVTNPPNLIIYGYIKNPFEKVQINVGFIKSKRIRLKKF